MTDSIRREIESRFSKLALADWELRVAVKEWQDATNARDVQRERRALDALAVAVDDLLCELPEV